MHRLLPDFVVDPGALGLFVLRVVAGAALMLHGYPKLMVASHWMGPESTIPGWLQALSTFTEFFGGLLLLLGAFTPFASIGIILTMAFALFAVHVANRDPFVLPEGTTGASYELVLLYLAIGVMYLLVGPGTHSVDFYLFRRKVKPEHQRARMPVWR